MNSITFELRNNCPFLQGNNNTFQQDIRTVSGESMPIKDVALVPFQIGEYNYTFYALAYDAILGSDFLGHYQSVIDFDNHSLRLLPTTLSSLKSFMFSTCA